MYLTGGAAAPIVASVSADSTIGPNLGPRPAEGGLAACDESHEGTGTGGLRYELRIRHERDPSRARCLAERQNEAIWELLRWWDQAQREIATGTRCPG
jgi:hypothetical protein